MLRKSRGRDVSGREMKGVRGGRRTNSGRGEPAVTGEERVSQDRRGGEEEEESGWDKLEERKRCEETTRWRWKRSQERGGEVKDERWGKD